MCINTRRRIVSACGITALFQVSSCSPFSACRRGKQDSCRKACHMQHCFLTKELSFHPNYYLWFVLNYIFLPTRVKTISDHAKDLLSNRVFQIALARWPESKKTNNSSQTYLLLYSSNATGFTKLLSLALTAA